ncbi:MAG TPA: dTDP-4-dehydrorhamnose 3,5-epimerase [Candidatus Baltobacteraceae bacterium]
MACARTALRVLSPTTKRKAKTFAPPNVQPTEFTDARLITPDVFADERGFFKETFSLQRYRDIGITEAFVQDNVSLSMNNVLRGLHGDRRMAKIVQVLQGEAFDVMVDLREGSATYGKWQGFELTQSNHAQLYIPAGFLHGFLAKADNTILAYKQSALYDPSSEFSIRWDDPTINIVWPLSGEPRLSAKDAKAPLLSEIG